MDDEEPGHSCADCGFMIECDKEACETADALEQLEESLLVEKKAVLVYIVGYITWKDPELDEVSLLGQTSFYFQKCDGYTDSWTEVALMCHQTGRASGPCSASYSSTWWKWKWAESLSARWQWPCLTFMNWRWRSGMHGFWQTSSSTITASPPSPVQQKSLLWRK